MSDEQQDAGDLARPYVADKPADRPTREQLQQRIPGWGADLDPADRPSTPRLRFDPSATGAHWTFPERQPDLHRRERSIEHGMLPPVFGTSAPLHGVSGLIRRHAYRRYSEARLAHWLLLIAGDRVDAFGARVRSLASLRPDNPVTETGIRTELTAKGPTSRADSSHRWIDPLLVAGPWIIGGWLVVRAVRAVLRHS